MNDDPLACVKPGDQDLEVLPELDALSRDGIAVWHNPRDVPLDGRPEGYYWRREGLLIAGGEARGEARGPYGTLREAVGAAREENAAPR